MENAYENSDPDKEQKVINYIMDKYYGNMRFSQRRMEYLHKLKALLEERNIPYIVFINPLNKNLLTALKSTEAYRRFLGWIQQTQEIFPGLINLSDSPYSAPQNFWTNDPFHYTPETGAGFINDMIANAIQPKRSSPFPLNPKPAQGEEGNFPSASVNPER